jgi:multisubunit Na+/H+ antiporter MnhF subunit
MNVFFAIAYLLLVAAATMFMVRLFRGPDVVDRIIALDGVLVSILGAVLIEASRTGSAFAIDTVLVVALLSFVGTGVLARYVEQRGSA